MVFMHSRRSCVNHQSLQLCLFAWAETLPTTVADEPEFACNHRLVQRVQRRTGWSEARCRAAIEANGGLSYV